MSSVDLHTSAIFDLRGRIALVSGGGTGIGLMIAGALAANGAKVYIGGRRKEVLERVADECATRGKGTIIPYVQVNSYVQYPSSDLGCPSFSLDVSSRDSIIEAKNLIEKKEGKLHILVNKYGLFTKLVDRISSHTFSVQESVDLFRNSSTILKRLKMPTLRPSEMHFSTTMAQTHGLRCTRSIPSPSTT